MYIEAIIWLLISLDGQNMAVCLDYASLGKMKEAVVMAIAILFASSHYLL